MTAPRSSDQILVDALVAEKARLSRRLEKLKAIQAADPLGELLQVHKEAAGIDFNTKEGLAKLAALAERERVARAPWRSSASGTPSRTWMSRRPLG